MLDYMLYKEALAASGYSVIKTDELEAMRAENKRLKEALVTVESKLSYLQNLWSKEGVTDGLVDQIRAALSGDK